MGPVGGLDTACYQTLISTSTPAGSSSLMRASTVFALLSSMSRSLQYESSSNCSRLFLLTKVERLTVKIFLFVGRGIGPLTLAPVAFTVSTILAADLST